MTSANSKAATSVATLLAQRSTEPSSAKVPSGVGFDAAMSQALKVATPGTSKGGEMKPANKEANPKKTDKATANDSTDALTLAGLAQALAIVLPANDANLTTGPATSADETQSVIEGSGGATGAPAALNSAPTELTAELKKVAANAATNTTDPKAVNASPEAQTSLMATRVEAEKSAANGAIQPLKQMKLAPDAQTEMANSATKIEATIDSETEPPCGRVVHSAAEAKFTSVESPRSAAQSSAPAGTGVAETADGMKNTTDLKQSADRAQQNLPLVAELAAVAKREARSGSDNDRSASLVSATAIFSANPLELVRAEEAANLPAMKQVSEANADALQVGMLKHAMEIRRAGTTEMDVVLRPDAETRLALHLTLAGGEVTVQARCEQGNVQALAASWNEIRDSLAQQGVRLGALEQSSERGWENLSRPASNGGTSPEGQSSPQRREMPQPESLDELPLVGSLTEPLLRRGAALIAIGRARRWESWA